MTRTSYDPVDPQFFESPTEEVARRLLDLVLVREEDDGRTVGGRIVECEMYQGPEDKGAHSYGGRPTPRTRVMFGPPGRAYVYFIYGMYHCINVVTAPEGKPHAILIRALEPLDGIDRMIDRQPTPRNVRDVARLAAGPGKVCRALAIDRRNNGHPLWMPPLYLAHASNPWPPYRILYGPRVNIDYAEEAAQLPWRLWVAEHPSVSRIKRGRRVP